MKKILGILVLLVVICALTGLLNPNFLNPQNIQNTLKWTALYGIISIGVAFVIITGGIDLSIGSVIGLVGSLLVYLLMVQEWAVAPAILTVMGLAAVIGLGHGLLVTRLGLQPFVVTLCGLLLYRGLARYVTDDRSLGFQTSFEGLRQLAIGKVPLFGGFAIPYPLFLLALLALAAGVFLNKTIYGRYLLALGRNETAARYSGIRTDRMKVLAYLICSLLAGLGGILFALELNSVQPSSTGEFYELYAIAAAVLGGCSLRGGEGTILGVVIGAAVLRVLRNVIIFLGIPTHLEFAIIGAVILAGVIVDEMVKRLAAHRREARREA